MTQNQIELKKLSEQNRTNKENEEIKKEGNRVSERNETKKLAGSITSSIFGLAGKAMNDKTWYNKFKQYTQDVARLPFGQPLGTSFRFSANHYMNFPGILAIHYVPSIGNSNASESSAINTAAKQIYAWIRHANSGRSNYEANDLMIYLLTMGMSFSTLASFARIYSLLNSAKVENRYWTYSMLQAAGVNTNLNNPKSLVNNISQFRAIVNRYSMLFNAFYVPKTFTYYDRQIWMNSSIFKDSEIKKSQNYIYVCDIYPRFNAESGTITFVPMPELDIDTVTQVLEDMYNHLITSEDIGIISGDILKAYGESGLWNIVSIPDNYHVEAVYSLEILSQINNAIPWGYFLSRKAGAPQGGSVGSGIYQDEDGKLYQGWFTLNADGTLDFATPDFELLTVYQSLPLPTGQTDSDASKRAAILNRLEVGKRAVLNFYKDSPDPDDIMVATRMTVCPSKFSASNTINWKIVGAPDLPSNQYMLTAVIDNSGSEIPTYMRLYQLDVNELTGDTSPQSNSSDLQYMSTNLIDFSETNSVVSINKVLTYSKFDWAPQLLFIQTIVKGSTPAEDNSIDSIRFYSDVANYTIIDSENIRQMHDNAMLSEFSIPDLGLKARSGKK